MKHDRRVFILEKDQTIIKQDLASHKLHKCKQIEELESKTDKLRDFKSKLKQQLDNVLEHTFNITEGCTEQM